MKLWRSAKPQPQPPVEARSWLSPEIPWGMATATSSGKDVSVEQAIRTAASFACIRVLTSTIASLPADVVREVGSARRHVTPTPPIVASPAASVRRRGFVAQTVRALATEGNAYWLVAGPLEQLDRPAQMETVDPAKVTWSVDPESRMLLPSVGGERSALWPLGRLVHIPMSLYLRPGSPVADSPVRLAAESIGTSTAAEEFGAKFFGDGAHPSVVLRSKQELTKEQAEAIKARVKASWLGRAPAVVGSGLEVDFPSVDTGSGQFLDLLRFEIEQACRFWGVPPAMVYAAVSGQNVTYANVTDVDLSYLKHSVGIWIADIEDAWTEMLTAGQAMKFNVNALLRAAPKDRHLLYGVRLKNKTMTVNEVRALEDEEPFDEPEYDEPGVPGGYVTTPQEEALS